MTTDIADKLTETASTLITLANQVTALVPDSIAEKITQMQAAYDLKVADFARETKAVEILAEQLVLDGHSPDGVFAHEGRSNSCRQCMALRKALRREAADA